MKKTCQAASSGLHARWTAPKPVVTCDADVSFRNGNDLVDILPRDSKSVRPHLCSQEPSARGNHPLLGVGVLEAQQQLVRLLHRTLRTAKPSARVAPVDSMPTGWPCSRAAVKDATRWGSTPMTFTSGLQGGGGMTKTLFNARVREVPWGFGFTHLMLLIAREMPAMRPPPPTGTTTASRSST